MGHLKLRSGERLGYGELYCVDSGSSINTTNNSSHVTDPTTTDRKVFTAHSGSYYTVRQVQPVAVLDTMLGNTVNVIQLHHSDHCYNLLSQSKLMDSGYTVTYTLHGVFIRDNTGKVVCKGPRLGALWWVRLTNSKRQTMVNRDMKSSVLWHFRLGHQNPEYLNRLVRQAHRDLGRGYCWESSVSVYGFK